ncbi:MAG: glycosyltransferase family 2 protein [Alphaproteobacteria bacterium]|nr:glycosyltransferase family 2 protein [Alphaproteobacteria bacterium]
MVETPAVSVIIVNHNAGAYLARCVVSLRAQTRPDFEALIVDNGSTDDSLALAQAELSDDPRFTVIEGRNIGFAAGNNAGAARAKAPLLATLNPDAFPEPDWLETLIAAADTHPDVDMFGSTQIDAGDPSRIDGAGDRYFVGGIPWREQTDTRIQEHRTDGKTVYETFAPCAAAALFRTGPFREVDGFDPRFFCFVEDVDLAFRLRLRGSICLQVIGARVLHVGGGAGGGNSDFARYHGTRNLIWCFFKNMPLALLLPVLPIHLAILLLLAAKGTARGDAGPTLRGIRDGLGGLGPIRQARGKHPPKGGTLKRIAKSVDWSPVPYVRRRNR